MPAETLLACSSDSRTTPFMVCTSAISAMEVEAEITGSGSQGKVLQHNPFQGEIRVYSDFETFCAERFASCCFTAARLLLWDALLDW